MYTSKKDSGKYFTIVNNTVTVIGPNPNWLMLGSLCLVQHGRILFTQVTGIHLWDGHGHWDIHRWFNFGFLHRRSLFGCFIAAVGFNMFGKVVRPHKSFGTDLTRKSFFSCMRPQVAL